MEKLPEHSALEQEIKELSIEIKERGLSEKGKEAVKTLVQEKISLPTAGPSTAPTVGSSILPDYLDKESPAVKLKVEKLLDLALHHGLKRAANEAKGMNPIEIDAFHDALTDKLYAELKARGFLKL